MSPCKHQNWEDSGLPLIVNPYSCKHLHLPSYVSLEDTTQTRKTKLNRNLVITEGLGKVGQRVPALPQIAFFPKVFALIPRSIDARQGFSVI